MVNIDRKWKIDVRDTIRRNIVKVRKSTSRLTDFNEDKNDTSIRWLKKAVLCHIFAITANLLLIGSANFLFVYVVDKYGEAVVILANFSLGLFKACYKKWIVLAVLKYSKWVVIKIKFFCAVLDEEDINWVNSLSNNDVFVCSNIQIVSNVIITLLLVLFESSQCFYGKIFGRLTVQGSDISYCVVRCPASLECCSYDTLQSNFYYTPPFIYYSNCSNFLLTSYLPVMFISFTFTGVIFPLLLIIQDWFLEKYYKPKETLNTPMEIFFYRVAKFQVDSDLFLTYIVPIKVVQGVKGYPAIVLDINQSLLTWTTSLGNYF
jgi:hypothetical protein